MSLRPCRVVTALLGLNRAEDAVAVARRAVVTHPSDISLKVGFGMLGFQQHQITEDSTVKYGLIVSIALHTWAVFLHDLRHASAQ